jgi:hypothetical protein
LDIKFEDGAPLEFAIIVGNPVQPTARQHVRLADLEKQTVKSAMTGVIESGGPGGIGTRGRKFS